MINASSMLLAVLSRDTAAKCIDIPPASGHTASIRHTLPIFWEDDGKGISIRCKNIKGYSQTVWSLYHAVLEGRAFDLNDVVFRDEDGHIAGCVSIEVEKRAEAEENSSFTVIIRDSSAVCR